MSIHKIDIKQFDLEFEKDIQTTECFVELTDTHLKYRCKYDSKHPIDNDDLMRGWKDQFHDFDTRIKRESFLSVEWFWNDKNDYWHLELEANGYPTSIILYFNDEKEMLRVFEILFSWVFKIAQN